MRKKLFFGFGMIILSIAASGCIALVAGAVGGAGTAVWLSNKIVQEVNQPMHKVALQAQETLKSLKLVITKETVKDNLTQIKSDYYDGKPVWIDIRKIDEKRSRIEIRVGIKGDEVAARKIMDDILKRL
ncbi:MAG: DUF3568 family protein [Candidatus Omnitrophica bacterium]|nr:DUF3568 family protein [Candidatus Omnitrophota bacterium]